MREEKRFNVGYRIIESHRAGDTEIVSRRRKYLLQREARTGTSGKGDDYGN